MGGFTYYVYIMANKKNGTPYTGVTNNLFQRVFEHKQDRGSVFIRKYGIHKLMYYEETDDVGAAIQREKQIKKWRRAWKISLIEEINPEWNDLAKEWFE